MATLFIDPGSLRTVLVLEAPQAMPDGLGGRSESWVEVATLFGHIEPLTARNRFGADQSMVAVTHQLTLRHRSGVRSGMRLRKSDRLFEIVTAHDPDETGRYLVCSVREEVA